MTSISGGVNHVGLDLGTLLILYAWSRPGSPPDWLLHIRVFLFLDRIFKKFGHSLDFTWNIRWLHFFLSNFLWFRSNFSHWTKTGLICWFFEILFRGNSQSIAILGDHFNCLWNMNATCLTRQRLKPSLDWTKGRRSVHPYQMLVCVWSQSRNSFWLKKPW